MSDGNTKMRGVRIPPDLEHEARAKAGDVDISTLVRAGLFLLASAGAAQIAEAIANSQMRPGPKSAK
jgi:hypothetical protein